MAYGAITGQLQNITPEMIIPRGIIAMWSGAANAIPDGWLLCNGQNGTPNLMDRFIVGAGASYGVGNVGGAATVALSVEQMPNHSHGFSGVAHTHNLSLTNLSCGWAGDHSHTVSNISSDYEGLDPDPSPNYYVPIRTSYTSITTSTAGGHTHTITGSGTISAATAGGTISSTGSGAAIENRPPYYALCYIMKS